MSFVVGDLDPLINFSPEISKCICQHANPPVERVLSLEETTIREHFETTGKCLTATEIVEVRGLYTGIKT